MTTTATHLVRLNDHGVSNLHRGGTDASGTEDGRTYAAVLAPQYGEGWITLVIPETDSRFVGTHSHETTVEGVRVGFWHVHPLGVEEVSPLVPDDDRVVEPTPVTFTAEDVESARREGRAAAEREFDRWKEEATATAHSYADRNGLCSEFDACMREIGLRPRTSEYIVTFSFSVTVESADDDAAADDALEYLRSDIAYRAPDDIEVEVV